MFQSHQSIQTTMPALAVWFYSICSLANSFLFPSPPQQDLRPKSSKQSRFLSWIALNWTRLNKHRQRFPKLWTWQDQQKSQGLYHALYVTSISTFAGSIPMLIGSTPILASWIWILVCWISSFVGESTILLHLPILLRVCESHFKVAPFQLFHLPWFPKSPKMP